MVAGIQNVTVEQADREKTSDLDPVHRTVFATVLLLADCKATIAYEDREPLVRKFNDLLVVAHLSFDLEDDHIVSMRADDDARVYLPSTHFSDEYGSVNELTDALQSVPGIDSVEPMTLLHDGHQEYDLTGPYGRAELTLDWSHGGGEWSAEISLSIDDRVRYADSLTCDHDIGARAGGSDGFDLYPPYVVSGDGPIATANPIWTVPARVIATVLGRPL